MYKIGEFSKLAKTTVKTLRYYEKERLLIPFFVDDNGYRYYKAIQLLDLSKIISLRQIGLSIEEIKNVLNSNNLNEVLNKRKIIIEKELKEYKYQLSKINYLIKENNIMYEVVTKELPECIVCYKEGIIKNYSEISNFIISSVNECKATNPDIKYTEPDYSYMNYLDSEHKHENIKIRYCSAVTKMGTQNETIKFIKLKPVFAICIYHRGDYKNISNAYAFLMSYIKKNNYEIIDNIR